jgi:hypothetical protein
MNTIYKVYRHYLNYFQDLIWRESFLGSVKNKKFKDLYWILAPIFNQNNRFV